jgi:uncharacterized low-complexity protein
MTPDSSITVRSTDDLVAVVPYVLGFHPTDSIVVLGLTDGQVTFGARYDLPPPDHDDAMHIAAIVARQAIQSVTLFAYGSPDDVTPAAMRLMQALTKFRVRVANVIRVTEGRWRSLLCTDVSCCPPEGKPCPSEESVVAAEATYRGQVALPSRQALVAQVAPVDGEARAAMVAATDRARARMTELITPDEPADRDGMRVRRAGRTAVREAETRYRSGGGLTDDEVAWLGVVLVDTAVNEYALDRSGSQEWQIQLWADVLRRVEQDYVPGPACLLGFAAWRAGRGALARVAVDRALIADPGHQMAGLLDEVLGLGIDPQVFARYEAASRQERWAARLPTAGPSAGALGWMVADGMTTRAAAVKPATVQPATVQPAPVKPAPVKPKSTKSGSGSRKASRTKAGKGKAGTGMPGTGKAGTGKAGNGKNADRGRSDRPERRDRSGQAAPGNGNRAAQEQRAARRPSSRRLR